MKIDHLKIIEENNHEDIMKIFQRKKNKNKNNSKTKCLSHRMGKTKYKSIIASDYVSFPLGLIKNAD
jgi:myo-inositol-1-phosphate synthase